MPSAFIDDGYTLDGYLAAVEGLYDAVSFQYRPITRRESAVLEDSIEKARDFDAAEVIGAKMVAEKLVSWDLVSQKGKPVPITHENLLKMQPVFGGLLLEIIRGRRPSDVRPHQTVPDPAHNSDASAGN